MAFRKTRSTDPTSKYKFLLGSVPSDDKRSILGSKLPTYNDVLLCFIAWRKHYQNADATNQSSILLPAAAKVSDEVCNHYKRAHIPVIDQKNVTKKIKQFYEKEFKSILKLNQSKRSKTHPKIVQFQTKLKTTMPFWPKMYLKK